MWQEQQETEEGRKTAQAAAVGVGATGGEHRQKSGYVFPGSEQWRKEPVTAKMGLGGREDDGNDDGGRAGESEVLGNSKSRGETMFVVNLTS